MYDAFKNQLPDIDPEETREWIESLDQVIDNSPARARFLLHRVLMHARARQIGLPAMVSSDYINTIAPEQEPYFPGDEGIERRIRRIIRWNAAVMVSRANKKEDGIGGHLSTYASAAALYEVGFNHFFRGRAAHGGPDQIYFQGHGAPGIYARAYLEGRLTEEQLDTFRREAFGGGLSSYPHPRLMREFWEFPTVSMGLSPLLAIYQARFNRYLEHRGIKDTSAQRVWCFPGDGEMDEPESMAALSIAAREGLDNLIFVVNCNLQRLDGPVRGNGKIIQELEQIFRGAGWHVIKVVWGREWDDLLARDTDGALVNKMNTTLDGDFQKYIVESGAYIREHFFDDPRLKKLVEKLSDDDLKRLRRGGHDYRKLYAAYATAVELKDAPVVILAKTVKGWTLGGAIEGRNVTHQAKKLSEEELRTFRDRLDLPIKDKDIHEGTAPYYHPGENSDEIQYLLERRRQLGGFVPDRRFEDKKLPQPKAQLFNDFSKGSGDQPVATTMAFVRLLRQLLRDKKIGKRVVPIIPDEARTFGMEALFPEFKIYAARGQLYEPVDAAHLLAYRESQNGQVMEEGITEAGSMGTFTAAGTSYVTHEEPMIPFFIFYSMFGFQRIGDFIWSLADQRGRGFLLGATAGRTTLNGEGLQHEDGHSLLLASTNPACLSYDPAFAYEIAAIVRDGIRRMTDELEDLFYYLVLYNEPYPQPERPPRADDESILQGLYLYEVAPEERKHRAQIFGSGTILREALRAQKLLSEHHDVAADVWSATSYQQLRGEALECERWNRLHPEEAPRQPVVVGRLESVEGPIVAATDYMKAVPDQIARWVPGMFVPLGTDGFGRSDSRTALRRFFEVDAEHIAVATLAALAGAGDVKPEAVTEAIGRYDIDPDRVAPVLNDA